MKDINIKRNNMIYQSSVLEESRFFLFLSKRINEFILMRNSMVNWKQWYIPCINWNKQIIRNLKHYCIKQLMLLNLIFNYFCMFFFFSFFILIIMYNWRIGIDWRNFLDFSFFYFYLYAQSKYTIRQNIYILL